MHEDRLVSTRMRRGQAEHAPCPLPRHQSNKFVLLSPPLWCICGLRRGLEVSSSRQVWTQRSAVIRHRPRPLPAPILPLFADGLYVHGPKLASPFSMFSFNQESKIFPEIQSGHLLMLPWPELPHPPPAAGALGNVAFT